MLWASLALVAGLALLAWSAERFVEGAAATAVHAGLPTLIIGMVVVGFGTSAPELLVSALAAWDGSPALALGNAYGSNIANIALILGFTALLQPVAVADSVLRRELPALILATALTTLILANRQVSRLDAVLLLALFALFMGGLVRAATRSAKAARPDDSPLLPLDTAPDAPPEAEAEAGAGEARLSLRAAVGWLVAGLAMMVVASRLLVWGAVTIARQLGVSDLVIGLTIVAVGTSLPELASSIVAVRKNQHDLAVGNIIGSNLFNTLAVVGLAGLIQPMAVPAEALWRDTPIMAALTVALLFLGRGKAPRRIGRPAGAILLAIYIGYTAWLVVGALV